MDEPRFTPYQPRPLSFLGVESVAGYRLKVYAIRYGEGPFERGRFAGGWEAAISCLPEPARTPGRPGVGFAILHQGRTADYFILCWWDQENELPARIFVRDADGWRPARDGESFCVWDLRVLWFEREAYVAAVLSSKSSGLEGYLGMIAEGVA